MIENQPIAKKDRMDSQPDRDMLSELPLSIIHIILALVPIRDAIKTSVLSSQWRYKWTSLPHLVFEEDCPIREYNSRDKFEERIQDFITRVLVLHNGPIHKFKLDVPFTRNCWSIGVWLLCLSRNDIRELIIDTNFYDSSSVQELHSDMYSCKKLTKLDLNRCILEPPPTTFKAFLFLRCLWLREVYLSTDEVESLVANCPLLEDFTSINCRNSMLRISAPNLKFLDLLDDYIEISVYAPLLAELTVELKGYGIRRNHVRDSSVCNYTNLMSGFSNLEKLSGRYYFTKHLSMGIDSCHDMGVFYRLKDIELDEVNFEDTKAVSFVVLLIAGAPNLQKLQIANLSRIRKYLNYSASELPHISCSGFARVPNFKLEKLRAVHMSFVIGLPPQMAFIKLLLERSPVLETMSFSRLSSEDKQNLSAELEGCSQAFPNVKLTY